MVMCEYPTIFQLNGDNSRDTVKTIIPESEWKDWIYLSTFINKNSDIVVTVGK